MSLRTELDRLVNIHGLNNVMYTVSDIVDSMLEERDQDVTALSNEVETYKTAASYWEAYAQSVQEELDTANHRADEAERELDDIRNNFSSTIRAIYEEESKVNG